MKIRIIVLSIIVLWSINLGFSQKTRRQETVQGKICGNPTIKCRNEESTFAPNDIPFEVPKNKIVYESQSFYAVILKSKSVKNIFDTSCANVVSENERLSVQELFTKNKVFTQTCGYTTLYYTGVKENTVFIAVYAGKNLAGAQNFLKVVKQTGKFEGAYIKKLQAQFNGT